MDFDKIDNLSNQEITDLFEDNSKISATFFCGCKYSSGSQVCVCDGEPNYTYNRIIVTCYNGWSGVYRGIPSGYACAHTCRSVGLCDKTQGCV